MAKLRSFRKNNKKGLSLLEVVLAVGTLAVGIVLIIQAFSFCVRMAASSCDLVKACFLAEDILQNLDLLIRHNQTVNTTFSLELENFYAKYLLATERDNYGLSRVDCEVGWNRFNLKQNFTVSTYLINF